MIYPAKVRPARADEETEPVEYWLHSVHAGPTGAYSNPQNASDFPETDLYGLVEDVTGHLFHLPVYQLRLVNPTPGLTGPPAPSPVPHLAITKP